jgi:hypothetical protein
VVTQVTAQLAPAVTGIVDLFTKFVGDATGGAIGTAITEAVFNAGEYFARVVDIWLFAGNAIAAVVGPVFDYFGSLLPEWSTTTNALGVGAEVLQRAMSLFDGIGKGFIGAWSNTIGYFSKAISYAIGAFANIVEKLGYSAETIRGLQANVNSFGDKAFAVGTDWATAAGKDIANAFSADFKPTELGKRMMNGIDGGAESMVEKWRAASAEARAKQDEATVKAGADAGAAIAAEVGKVAGALDARSTAGVNEIVRMMNGGSNDVQNRQLRAQERIADATEEMAAADPVLAVMDF